MRTFLAITRVYEGHFRCQLLLLRSTNWDTINNLLARTPVGDPFRKSFSVSDAVSEAT